MNKKNLAVSTIALGIDADATSIQVESPELLPDAPFKATLQPSMAIPNWNNSEIINVTAKTGNILTVERGIDGTNKSFEPGDLLTNGVYVEDLDDIESYVDSVASNKQDNLVSGTNIKTVNGTSVLGTGDIVTPNTTYTEISESEIIAGTASTARSITGRRAQNIVDKAQEGVVKSETTNNITVSDTAPASPQDNDIWVDESEEADSLTLAKMLDFFYPVGTVYINGVSNENPSLKLGGIWEPYAPGRAIVGLAPSGTFNEVGKEIGEETHTLTVSEMPSHDHSMEYGMNTSSPGVRVTVMAGGDPYNSRNPIYNEGGGQAHNNIQPSKVAAAWIRTE